MDYIILLFSCIAEYLIFSDFFDAFLSIRPNFQPIWNRILIAIPFIGIYFGINTLQISYLNMISFICLLLLYSFLYEANFKERLLYIVFLCAIFFGCEFLFVVLLNLPAYLFHSSSVANLSTIPWQIFTLKLLTYLICCLYKQTSVKSAAIKGPRMSCAMASINFSFCSLLSSFAFLCRQLISNNNTDPNSKIRQL